MTGKDKSLTGEDEALWAFIAADVTPMKGKKAPVPPPPPIKANIETRGRSIPTPPQDSGKTKAPAGRDLDKRTRERFEGGKMPIEARLDLHGMDRGNARVEVRSFLMDAWQQAMRCVLIVTGKGRTGEGVLRSHLPDWVKEPGMASIVLDIAPAKKHGGSGAFYVLLRRQRL